MKDDTSIDSRAGCADSTPAGWPRPVIGDLSGAYADLGTFLPLVVGILVVSRFDAASVLIGFGVFAVATAAIFRRPVPIQPMKVVTALTIAGGLSPEIVAASGLLIGIVMCGLAVTGAVGMLARLVPPAVLTGVTVGIGLHLALMGGRLMVQDLGLAAAAAAVLLLVWWSPFRPLASVAVLVSGIAWGLAHLTGALPSLAIGLHAPALVLPGWPDVGVAAGQVVLPQLALTLTNAVLVTASIGAAYFPGDRQRFAPIRLAYSTGFLNLVLAPFGAFPMCHGAGGLVVQHKFGARSGLAPLLFGLTCLLLGVLYGNDALVLLQIIPMAAVGVLLVFAGLDLAWGRRLRAEGVSEIIVMLITAALCITINIAAGLVVGWALQLILRRVAARGN